MKRKLILSKVVGLERHKYAPELNELHFKSGKTIRVRYCTTLNEAISTIIDNLSDSEIEKL